MPLLFEDAQNMPSSPAVVKNGSMQSFKQDVIETSTKKLVFAYFYSLKNQQSQQFLTLLEKYIRLSNGAAVLVKFTIEDCQQLAVQLGVKGIPTTFIFAKGQLADGFAGAVPESQLKMVMQALIGKSALSLDQMLQEADQKLQQNEPSIALELYAGVLEKDEMNAKAFAGMIRCFIALKQLDVAVEFVEGLDPTLQEPSLESAKSALKIALETKDAPDPDTLKTQLEAEPDNLQVRFDYAVALFNAQEHTQSFDILISIIAKDPKWNEDLARQQMFKFFTVLGNANPVTLTARRKLSSLLFS